MLVLYNRCANITPSKRSNLTSENDMTDAEKLLKTLNLLIQVMGNYQVAASIAGQEGYETNYMQDAILVDFLKNDISK